MLSSPPQGFDEESPNQKIVHIGKSRMGGNTRKMHSKTGRMFESDSESDDDDDEEYFGGRSFNEDGKFHHNVFSFPLNFFFF